MKINKYNGRLKPQHINNYINYKLSKYTKEKHGPVRWVKKWSTYMVFTGNSLQK